MRLAEHALVVYLYATVVGEDADHADAAYQQLRQAWSHLADRLQLTVPADGAPRADPDSRRPDASGSHLLAGRTAAVPGGGVRQMWCNQVHDVVCLSLALTRNGAPDPDWAGLHQEWTDAAEGLDLDKLLGVVEVFTASTGHSDAVLPDPYTIALVRDGLPPPLKPGQDWQPASAATTGGLTLLEVSTIDQRQPPRRTLAALAPSGKAGDAELSRWVWQPGLGRLAMYLLNDAKLRHQAHVVRRDRPIIADLRRRASHTLAELQPLITDPTSYSASELRQAHTTLSRLQATSNGIIDALARVSIVRRTIAIAAANMTTLTGTHIHPHHTSLVEVDQRVAQRLDIELDDEYTYLTAARDRVQHFTTVAAEGLHHHRHQVQQANQHRENRFILFQTAVIGAILMALTAVQAFDYRIGIPELAQPAIIAALGLFALLLYTYALRRADLTQRPHQRPPAWITAVVSLTAGATTASATWALINLDWPSLRLPTLTTALIAASITFTLTVITAALILNRRKS